MLNRKQVLLWCVFLGALASYSPAFAASFDCGQAKTTREKLICSSPVLSGLDSDLGQIYQERRALLSSHGAKLLQTSQQGWLHFIGKVCPATSDSIYYRQEYCLEKEYRDRLTQLSMIKKIGPFIFNRVDIFDLRASPSRNFGSRPGFQYRQIAFPQIDNADSRAASSWNISIRKELSIDQTGDDAGDYIDQTCDDAGDYDAHYAIGYANGNVISIQKFFNTYCHGAAHGFSSNSTDNIVLHPTPHQLDVRELFGANDAWAPKLKALFWKALQEQGWTPKDNAAKEEILNVTIDPRRWLLTPEGIRIDFDSYEGGCYICTPAPIQASWTDMTGILAPNAVVP